MVIWTLILSVLPIVASITVSSNGNSPEIKMIGGMMVDMQKGFTPIMPKMVETTTKATIKKNKLNNNSTKLSINERYRRLIPYMTFYYANDLVTPPNEAAKNVEVEKAEIIEAKTIQQQTEQRQPKKIYYNSNRNIPIYQGNRLTQYNIASANPTKYFYKGIPSQGVRSHNYNPLLSDIRGPNNDFEYQRIVPKPIFKAPSVPFSAPTRKPYLNLYENDDSANIRYYIPEKEQTPKYKLVPYEQTPPVKVEPQSENIYHVHKPLAPAPFPVHAHKEQVYIKPRPARPIYIYDNSNIQSTGARKPPSIVSENYYEKQRPHNPTVRPIIEGGFRPLVSTPFHTTESTLYQSTLSEDPVHQYEPEKPQNLQVLGIPAAEAPKEGVLNPNYFQYLADQPSYKPTYVQSNTVTLADLLNSLQLNKSIPKPITRENVGASIRTLLQVLNALKALPTQNEAEPVFSTPKPLIENKMVEITAQPIENVTPVAVIPQDPDFHDEPYLAPVNTPSQHIDEYPSSVSTSQRFPLPITSDDEGGTPGRPGVDYPVLTTIPPTAFDCKTQRYKGFFADPETRCQVWHYCDLNGGQASFLCPNGTIFSQAGLTCDWWFNVRCASTAQLYVLNESLYKYILPHSPKFPEDYSGPLVDKYLTLKFKEMEEQFQKNKHKSASEKMDSDETENSTEDSSEVETSSEQTAPDNAAVSEASVIVGSPGTSGNVERLQD